MSSFKDIFERKEIKYIVNEDQYDALMEKLQTIAQIDDYGLTSIYNIYFDTPDFQLIRSSLEKPKYKEKLRLRTYGIPEDDSTAFIEIKKKYEGIVYKRRIGMTYEEAIDYLCRGGERKDSSQIGMEIDYFLHVYRNLVPTMAISYDRIAMIGIYDPNLRITFDTNLRWSTKDLDLRAGNHGRQLLQPGQHLMEIKIDSSMRLDIAHWLNELGIFPESVSKYGKGFLAYEEMAREAGSDYAAQAERVRRTAAKAFESGEVYRHRRPQAVVA